MADPYSTERLEDRPRVVKHLVQLAGLFHLASEASEHREHRDDLAAAAEHIRQAVVRLGRWKEGRR